MVVLLNQQRTKERNRLLPSDSNETTAQHGTIEFLIRRMRHKGDLPAFSRNIIEINKKLSSLHAINFSSSGELAGVILKDISLTNKLLKVVNSSLYGGMSGKVTTVSRAVFLLGAEKVRIVAASLMILDHLQNKRQAGDLQDASVLSFFTAVLARAAARKIMFGALEEVFICALLHNLGKHLVICYFPEEYQEIKNLVRRQDPNEERASKTVLGVSYSELGKGIAETWGFPQSIIDSMGRLEEKDAKPPTSDNELLKRLANYADDLCAAAVYNDPLGRSAALRSVTEKYKTSIPLPESLAQNLIEEAVVDIGQYAEAFHIDTSASLVLRHLSAFHEPDKPEDQPRKGIAMKAERRITPQPLSAREAKDQILKNCIAEISELLATPSTLSDAIYMILETMYRAFEFNRVIFCMMDAGHSKMSARFGFGANIDTLLEGFSFKISHASDYFDLSVWRRKDFVIQDSRKAGVWENLPVWYLKIITAGSFLIYPLVVKDKCIGLFYADKKKTGILSEDERHFMNILRDKAIWAILHKR